MNFRLGDFVTRVSHKHDIIFKIVGIEGNIVFLKGVDLRLFADSDVSDLVRVTMNSSSDKEIIDANIRDVNLDRSQYFYLPGKILHIDGDEEYLERCMNFYKEMNIKANGLVLPEAEIADHIGELLSEYRPDIVVITGHDAHYERKLKENSNYNYQNSANFIEAVKVSRRFEKSQDKLIIIAGACQSNYEDLIKAGANFASSPKRINIHALDPAIIAASLALSDRNQSIDVIKIIDKTKYGSEGMGGIITNGTMYVGYPR